MRKIVFLSLGITISALTMPTTAASAQDSADVNNEYSQRHDGTTDSMTIHLELGPLERGIVFGCRMPVDVEVQGPHPLVQFTIIARAMAGVRELASTGFTLTPAIIRKPVAEGPDQVGTVPRQFEFSPRVCLTMDGLRIVFARCEFQGYPSIDCLDEVRFVRAAPDRPLYIEVD